MKNKKFFNEEIINDLFDLIYGNPILLDFNYDFYRQIYSFCYNVLNKIRKLNEIIYSIDNDYQLIYLISFIHSINTWMQKIKKEAKNFNLNGKKYSFSNINFKNHGIFYKEWKKSFIEGFNVKEDEINIDIEKVLKEDNIFFNYLRTMAIHPFDIKKTPIKYNWLPEYKNKGNNEKKNMEEFFNKYVGEIAIKYLELQKNIISINITTLKKHNKELLENEINEYDNIDIFIKFSLDNLIKYAKIQYEKIKQISIWLKWLEKEYYKEINKNINSWSNDNLEFLKQIIEVLKNKYVCTDFFEKLLEEYDIYINRKLIYNNYELISEYFNEVFITLRKIRNKFKLVNNEKLSNIENNISSLYKYKIENIILRSFERLYGKRTETNPYFPYNKNIIDGLVNAKYIYQEIAYQYVNIDIDNPNLEYSEIRLSIKAALWKFNKVNKI